MKRFAGIMIALFTVAWTLEAAEIPPFNPPTAAKMPRNTTFRPGEVKITLSDGKVIESGRFNRSKSLNGVWRCSGLECADKPFPADVDQERKYAQVGFDDSKWDKIRVPLNWYKQYPKIYDAKRPYIRGFYRHEVEITPAELDGKQVILHFGVIGYEASLSVNGETVGRHHGDFVPWTVDITRFVKPGKNLLALKVLSDFGPARSDIKTGTHTYGSQWSVSNIKGGIWQNVELRFESPIRFTRMLITPEIGTDTLRIDYRIENSSGKTVKVTLGGAVTAAIRKDANQLNATAGNQTLELVPGVNSGTLSVKLSNPVKWDLDNPYLYYATLYLESAGRTITARSERFGFREFKIVNGKFHLNGRRIYLFGENLPSVLTGGNGTDGEDIDVLYKKMSGFKSLGYNIIRNAHMPALVEFYDLADEIGLMIYDEWGWCFTNAIDEPEFAKRNPVELEEWLERDYNHPSVTIWSCGNEVVHRNNPAIQRQLDRQVDMVRAFDQSRRPVGSFSGSGSWGSYGEDPRNTDFIDLHSYIGNGSSPWTTWSKNFNIYYTNTMKHYHAGGKQLAMPYIIWECVGFSWGGLTDPKFKIGDMTLYAKYAKLPTTWAKPNGIGYSGTIGLARALQPGSLDYAKEHYGQRILEQIRQDIRIDGFAPWFHGYDLPRATLWNQPVLVGLRNDRGLPPVNFFAGKSCELSLYVVNQSSAPVKEAVARVVLQTAPDRSIPLGSFTIPSAAPFELTVLPVRIALPADFAGHGQIRLELLVGDKSVSRNFYNVFVQSPAILHRQIATARKIALLDVGEKSDVEATAAILTALGLKYEIIGGKTVPIGFDFAIIPASLKNTHRLAINPGALVNWLSGGGTLLILEQNHGNGSVVGNMNVLGGGNTFVDLVFPAHPVFKNLDQRNFDTWENPNFGNVVEGAISPFSTNAIAVKGPMLGGRNVESAIIEATVGKGHLFWSQLSAVKLWGKDSSASTYLVNVFDYLLSGKRFAKVTPLVINSNGDYQTVTENLVPVNLQKFVNRSFSDDIDNDGKGGWTDQGRNDFRNMPLGRQKVAGVDFDIIDPAKNHGKSCIVLRGSNRPRFPEAVRGIPVNARFSRIFFLHTSAWNGTDAGRYRMNYSDGSHCDYVLVPGVNIGDWWNCSYLSQAKTGILAPNPTKDQVVTYVASWENPYPEKEIKTIDFFSASCPDANTIDYNPSRTPVPVLVALTGEKIGEKPLVIVGTDKPGIWRVGNTVKNAAVATVGREKTLLPNGLVGEAVKVKLPASGPQNAVPYAFVRFEPDTYEGNKVNYLSFWISADSSGAIDLAIPGKDWKAKFSASIDIGANGSNWVKVRIPLERMGRDKMKKTPLRGEMFFYNGSNRNFAFPRQAVTFRIADIRLE